MYAPPSTTETPPLLERCLKYFLPSIVQDYFIHVARSAKDAAYTNVSLLELVDSIATLSLLATYLSVAEIRGAYCQTTLLIYISLYSMHVLQVRLRIHVLLIYIVHFTWILSKWHIENKKSLPLQRFLILSLIFQSLIFFLKDDR